MYILYVQEIIIHFISTLLYNYFLDSQYNHAGFYQANYITQHFICRKLFDYLKFLSIFLFYTRVDNGKAEQKSKENALYSILCDIFI